LGAGGAAAVIALSVLLLAGGAASVVAAAAEVGPAGLLVTLGVLLFLLGVLVPTGVAVINPGETVVVQFFGRYLGTVRTTGLVATVPLSTRRRVSVRVRNFETSELKVNDADGNPINIAAIVVWQVADTAKASFAVEDYTDFVRVQAESALRHVAMSHPYDDAEAGEQSLRGATEVVSAEIAAEVAARVVVAGVEVIEARISNLAYAPEIAQAMLQRQQAGAIQGRGGGRAARGRGRRHARRRAPRHDGVEPPRRAVRGQPRDARRQHGVPVPVTPAGPTPPDARDAPGDGEQPSPGRGVPT